MPIKISTLNLCLGLNNKKFLVKKLLEEHEIDVLFMQEMEIDKDLDSRELMTSGYSLELENNYVKSRVGFYVSKTIRYVRRSDLEGENSNVIIVDLDGVIKSRVINVHRSSALQNREITEIKI